MKKLLLLVASAILAMLAFLLAMWSLNLVDFAGQFLPDIVKRNAYLIGIVFAGVAFLAIRTTRDQPPRD